MSEIIPLQPVPNQTLTVLLDNQVCRINVYQKFFGLFLDMAIGAAPKGNAIICQDRNRLIRYSYIGFVGELVFFDTQGTSDPIYTGLGSRFRLLYVTAAELAAAGV